MASPGYASAFTKAVTALVESARDSNEEVRDHIESSLFSLAKKDFGGVLDITCKFLTNNKPSSTTTNQRVSLLKALHRICVEWGSQIGDQLIRDLVSCSVSDMTAQLDINSPWQLAGMVLTVDLCCINPSLAIPYVVNQIPGTSLPHYFIMRSLSEAAAQRPLRFLPFMKDCMAKVLPILGMAKQDNVRFMMADALSNFADAISQLSSLPELTPRSAEAAQCTAEDFYEPMYTALSLLLNDWATARDLKVRGAVALALGRLSAVIHPDRLEEKLPSLIKHLTAAVKKEKPKDQLPVLQGLACLIGACMAKALASSQVHMEPLWQCLFQNITAYHSLSPTEQTELLKNHKELMLGVETMAIGAPDTVLTFIQKVLDPKFGSKDATNKCAALACLRHLVHRHHLEAHLAQLKNHVVAIVRMCLDDPDYRVKRAIVQGIMSMGASANNNYLACEGGESLIEFVIQQASIPPHHIHEWGVKNKKLLESGQAGPQDVKDISSHVLHLFVTTLPHLDTVLWPYVLEIVGSIAVKPELLYSFSFLSNAIVQIGKRLGNSHDFYFDFDLKVNVPRPEALIATFVVMASQPQHTGKDGCATVLSAMETLAPLLDEPMKKKPSEEAGTPLGSLWLGTLPELRSYLTSDEFKQEDFEEACHNLLKKTASAKKEEAWTQALTSAFANQLGQWCPPSIPPDWLKERHDYKRVALSLFGLVLARANLKSFVTDNIVLLAEACDHTNELERLGCSRAFGYISATYTDAVLDKLNRMAKPPKASGGLFSKKVGVGPDRDFGELSRATVLISYGFVSKRSPQQLFTSRLETHVVPTFLEVLSTNKNPVIKEAGLVCMQMLGASVRKSNGYNFTSKTNVMNTVVAQLPLDSTVGDHTAFNLLQQGVLALTPLVFVDPVCDRELIDKVKLVVNTVLTKEWADDALPNPEADEKALQKQAGQLYCALLEASPDLVGMLVEQALHLSSLMRSDVLAQREKACKLFITLLKHFGKLVDHRGVGIGPCSKGPVELGGGETPVAPQTSTTEPAKKPSSSSSSFFSKKDPTPATPATPTTPQPAVDGVCELSVGTFLARLLPRLADVSLKVRTDALDGILFCMKLYMIMCGKSPGVVSALEVAKGLVPRLNYKEDADMIGIIREVTAALCGFLGSNKELALLIDELIVHGLLDPVEESSVAVCATLSGMFKALGNVGEATLTDDEVKLFVNKMVVVVGVFDSLDKRDDCLRGTQLAMKALAKHRPTLIFNELLTYPIPHTKCIVQTIQTLANDTGLSRLIVNHCLDVLLNAQLHEDGYTSGSKTLALTAPVVAACCTLGEIFETAKGADVARALAAPLFSSIAVLMSAAHESPKVQVSEEQKRKGAEGSPPPPAQLVNVALKSLVTSVFSELVTERIRDDLWALLEANDTFPTAICTLVSAIIHDVHPEGNKDEKFRIPMVKQIDDLQPTELSLRDDEPEEQEETLPPTTACKLVEDIYEFMISYVQKVYDSHRRCAICVLGQLLCHCKGNDKMLQGIINCLLSRAGADEKVPIKLQAIHGLSYLSVHQYDSIKLFIAPVISSLITCCSDNRMEVCLAAMITLEDLIQRVGCKQELSAVVVNMCIRTKASIENADARVRRAGCSLFGVMAKLAVLGTLDYSVMESNVQTHLGPILVHINDENPYVRFASKKALREIVSYLNASPPSKKAPDHLNRLLEREHMDPYKQTNFDEFANEFAKIWVRFYGPHVNDLLVTTSGYFQCSWAPVRAASAVFCGTLLRHLSESDQARSNLESTCSGLIGLMKKDNAPIVRTKAAKALGMLGDMI